MVIIGLVQQSHFTTNEQLSTEFSEGALGNEKESHGIFIRISFIPLSQIAGNAHSAPAKLIAHSKILAQSPRTRGAEDFFRQDLWPFATRSNR
jgi:hypothetical protein